MYVGFHGLVANFHFVAILALMICINSFIFFSKVVALVHTLMTHEDIKMQRVLVVAPLNTVLNWQVEFDKWLSVDDRLEVKC